MRYFVIATDPMTSELEKKFLDSLTGITWWHWLPNFWLIIDKKDNHTVASIRDSFKGISSTHRCVVLEVEPKTWAAMSKKDAQGRQMSDWLDENWK